MGAPCFEVRPAFALERVARTEGANALWLLQASTVRERAPRSPTSTHSPTPGPLRPHRLPANLLAPCTLPLVACSTVLSKTVRPEGLCLGARSALSPLSDSALPHCVKLCARTLC